MNPQLTIFEVHHFENNSDSKRHLEENKSHFSAQCGKVLQLLKQGKRLSTINAPRYGILSLPRRIKDLRDHNGIEIDYEWIREGKVKYKEFFLKNGI